MTVTQLGNPTVYSLTDTGDQSTVDGVLQVLFLNTKNIDPSDYEPTDKMSAQAAAKPYVGTFIYNTTMVDPPMATKQSGFQGFASLITPPAGNIYDLSIPPIPIRGIMYPQFVRTINNG